MRRITLDPRPNWQTRVEEYGLHFHTLRGEPYWDESACYQFTEYQIDAIDLATQTLHEMCMQLVEEVIDKRMFALFLIPPEFEDFIIQSWEAREPSVYARFDLAYDGTSPPTRRRPCSKRPSRNGCGSRTSTNAGTSSTASTSD